MFYGKGFNDGPEESTHESLPHESYSHKVGDETHQKLNAEKLVVGVFSWLGSEIQKVNDANGWDRTTKEQWADKYRIPGDLALMHSELSEALEAFRLGDLEHFTEELSDTIIRILSLAYNMELDLARAVLEKIEKNRQRGYHHGGKKRI